MALTSLAAQLKRLQTPQTQLLEQGIERASLLFDSKDASSLDRETIFAIGCSGLEEISKVNPSFSKFGKSLFHETSKDFQRAVQTKEQNEQLDASITEFLHKISPYLLLRPAHKTLEWLIYRFRVQEYNTVAFLQMALPFHESNIFARLIQIIDFKDQTACWHFLISTKQQGAVLTKKALIAQCVKNPGLFRFVCDLLPSMRKLNHGASLRPAINLTTGVIIGVLELHRHRIDNKLVSAIVAHVADGLVHAKQDLNSEWVSANLMVIGQLVRKEPALKTDILQLLLITVAKVLTSQTLKAGILTLQVTYRYQTSLVSLPQKVVKALVCFENLPDQLLALVKERDETNRFFSLFVYGLFVQILTAVPPDRVREFLQPYLRKQCDEVDQAAVFTAQFLKAYVATYPDNEACIGAASEVLKLLKQRAGDELDKALDKGLQGVHKQLVSELLTTCSLGIRHLSIGEQGETVFVALMSKSPHLRLAAVNEVIRQCGSIVPDDFIKKSMRNLLVAESEASVYDSVIKSLDAGTVLKFMSADEAIEVFRKRICSFRKKKWLDSNLRIVRLVGDSLYSEASLSTVLAFVLTLSATVRSSDLTMLEECLKCNVVTSGSQFKHLLKCKLDGQMAAVDIVDVIASSLAKGFKGSSVSDYFSTLLNGPADASSTRTRFASLKFVEQLVVQSKPLPIGVLNQSLDTLHSMLDSGIEEHEDEVDAVANGQLPISSVVGVVCALLKNFTPVKELETLPAWHRGIDSRSSEVAFLQRVFSIGIQRFKTLKSFRRILSCLFETCLPTGRACCNFLTGMLLTHMSGSQTEEDFYLQAHALCLMAFFIGDVADTLSNSIVLSVVVVLLSPSKRVRRLALTVLGQAKQSDEFIGYVVNHVNCLSDPRAVLSCVSAFHSKHENAFLDRMLNDADLSPVLKLGIVRLVETVNSATTIDACAKLLAHYAGCPAVTIDSNNRQIIRHCLTKIAHKTSAQHKLPNGQRDVLLAVLTSENETLSLLGLEALSAQLLAKMNDVDLKTILDLVLSSVLDAQSDAHRRAAERALMTLCQRPKLLEAELAKVTVEAIDSIDSVRDVKRMRLSNSKQRTSIAAAVDSAAAATPAAATPAAATPAAAAADNHNHNHNSKRNGDDDDPLQSDTWKRVVIILELLHGVETLPDVAGVVDALYHVLRRSLEITDSASVEYVKQCVMSCLQVHATSDKMLQLHQHQISLLVKALRLSQSSQTQHAILNMLNHMARLYPEEVLQNMTSVFTFMGTSLLRQEDEYSFQVVLQTINSVIPILLEASHQKSNNNVVSKVTRVFVDSWVDIPDHRRYPIIKKLIETLGAADYAWTLVAQSIDHLLEKGDENLKDSELIDFLLGLVGDFTIHTILATCQNLLRFAVEVPFVKKDANRSTVDAEIIDVVKCDDRRLSEFKAACAVFVEQLLSGTNFLTLSAELDDSDSEQIEPAYEGLLSTSLESIHKLSSAMQRRKTDDLLPCWKSNWNALHDCVDCVNGVLRPNALIAVVDRLLSEKLPSIRRNAMDILNNKLISETFFDDCDSIHRLLSPLCDQLFKNDDDDGSSSSNNSSNNNNNSSSSNKNSSNNSSSSNKNSSNSNDEVLNQQTALVSLKLICRRMSTGHEDDVSKLFDVVEHGFRRYEKLPDVIVGGVLLLFAELCHSYPTKTLTHFAKLMRRFLAISSKAEKSEPLVLGLVVAYRRLVESLTGFLSPYLAKLICHVCRLCSSQRKALKATATATAATATAATATGPSSLEGQLQSTCVHLGEQVPLRVLLPAIEDCLDSYPVVDEPADYLVSILRVFRASIESSEQSDFEPQRDAVHSVVLKLLCFREQGVKAQGVKAQDVKAQDVKAQDVKAHFDSEKLTEAEAFIVDSVTALSLKLSAASFRPFITKLHVWATMSSPDADEGHLHRTATFYHLLCKLSDTLQGLFVQFAGQFIQHAADTLERNRKAVADERVQLECTGWILATVSNCCQYGEKCFVSRELYATVVNPLVSEIEHVAECSAGGFEHRLLSTLCGALANLAVSCPDADCKDLHNRILFKTRNPSSKIRLTALQVFAAVVRRLGDDYMPLLPESVPFLAELMEDECTQVEKLTQEIVQEMEQLLGEPLMKYF